MITADSGAQPGLVLGQGRCLGLEHFDKSFMYGIQKKGLAGKNFGVFFSKKLTKLRFKLGFNP